MNETPVDLGKVHAQVWASGLPMFMFTMSTMASVAVNQPIDRIANILQVQHALPSAYKSLIQPGNVLPNAPTGTVPIYRGAIDLIRNIPKDSTLWRGFTAEVYGRVLGLFAMKEIADRIKPLMPVPSYAPTDNPEEIQKRFIMDRMIQTSGAYSVASVFAIFVIFPFSVASMRMQANLIPKAETKMAFDASLSPIIYKNNFSNTWMSLKGIIAEEGITGIYRGFWTSVPALSLKKSVGVLAAYDVFRIATDSKDMSIWQKLLVGHAVAITSGTLYYPFGLISKRLQVQAAFRKMVSPHHMNDFGVLPEPIFYKGGIDAAKTIIKNEGFRGLYRGWLFFIAKAFSIGFTAAIFDSMYKLK